MAFEITIPFRRILRGLERADGNGTALATVTTAGLPAAQAGDPLRQAREERESIQRVLSGLTTAARSLEVQQSRALAEMQRAAVELAVAIASHLVHEKLEAGNFAVEALVRKVVGHLGARQPVTVSLHPDDLSLLQRRLGDDQLLFRDGLEVKLVADPSLGRGGCRADAGDVSIISQLDAQLVDLRQHLLRGLAHARIERRKSAP